MKLKITIWLTDPQTSELSKDDTKKELEHWIRSDAFGDSGCEIKQIEIEETEFED